MGDRNENIQSLQVRLGSLRESHSNRVKGHDLAFGVRDWLIVLTTVILLPWIGFFYGVCKQKSMRVTLDRSSRRWLERKVYVLISTLVGFWVIVVFVLVYHAMKQSPKLSRSKKAHLRVSHEIQGMNLRTRMPRNETNINISPISNQSIHQYVSDKLKDEVQIPILPLVKNASPLLVFTFQREDYLAQTLSQILKHIPKSCTIGCPIVVSQDGYKKEVAEVIARFQNEYQGVIPIIHWQHEPAKVSGMAWEQGYKKLAIHYGWALERIFKNYAATVSQDNLTPRPDRVIILEEDLMISPDFFHYFAAMIPLLEKPESNVFTISAFNDNGKEGMVKDLKRVLHGDCGKQSYL
jgi:GNT-I family